jgi:hypothetical protein
MSATKGIGALLLLAGAGVVLIRWAAPDQVETPKAIVASGVEHARAEARARPGFGPDRSGKMRLGGGGSHDPLQSLIAAKGYSCGDVVAVQTVEPAEGVFTIICERAGSSTTYQVDTRHSRVTPTTA